MAARTDNLQSVLMNKDPNAKMELRKDHARINNHHSALVVLNQCAVMVPHHQDQSQKPVKWRRLHAKTSLLHLALMVLLHHAPTIPVMKRLNAKPPGSVTTIKERNAPMVNSQEFHT